jgi:lysyl-tRNA synthetase class I
MKPYLYLSGLKRLAKEVVGNEVIHIGIRPYGFHAGNAMALVGYPYVLCQRTEVEGKIPKFTFVISLNEWEQDSLDGPDYRKYPYNIHPKSTILRFAPDDNGCCSSIADHWIPIIKKRVLVIKKRFPGVTVSFILNSELVKDRFCRSLLIDTIQNPHDHIMIYKKYTDKEILKDPVAFSNAVCPYCKSARGKTSFRLGKINLDCVVCGTKSSGSLSNFHFWWYHKPMLTARLKKFDVDITLSGGDHFDEKDFEIRKAFMAKYVPNIKIPKMLFTPTVLASDGEKMSKSRGNTAFVDFGKLIQIANNWSGKDFVLPEEITLNQIDDKDYSHIL